MSKLLERPAAKKSVRPQTPFHYEATGPYRAWLACPPLWNTPVFPSRERCQREVLDAERVEAERIIREYREAEKTSADNDLGWRQKQLYDHSLNPAKRLTAEQCQMIHREMLTCDGMKFELAQVQMRALQETAGDLARTILERLIKSFDEELLARTVEAEQRLIDDGIPLQTGQDWELWRDPSLLRRHCWREVTKNAIRYLNPENTIGCVQWLATSEENTPNVPWI